MSKAAFLYSTYEKHTCLCGPKNFDAETIDNEANVNENIKKNIIFVIKAGKQVDDHTDHIYEHIYNVT